MNDILIYQLQIRNNCRVLESEVVIWWKYVSNEYAIHKEINDLIILRWCNRHKNITTLGSVKENIITYLVRYKGGIRTVIFI